MQHKRTYTTKPVSEKTIERSYLLLDAKHQILGRLASEASHLLQGKHKATYVPHLDSGDYVIVINAKNVEVTGNKLQSKTYQKYSGYPGGQREILLATMMKDDPAEAIRHAVSGMLPKNKLRDRRMTRLYIFAGPEHTVKNKEILPVKMTG